MRRSRFYYFTDDFIKFNYYHFGNDNCFLSGEYMSTKQKLKRALNEIDDAQRALVRARNISPENQDIRRALNELEGAELNIKRAIRELD